MPHQQQQQQQHEYTNGYVHHYHQPYSTPAPNYSASVISQRYLDSAANLLSICIEKDKQFSDLRYKLHLQKIEQPTVSGLNDNDYPSYDSLNFATCAEFVPVRRNPLPQDLLDQISRMECNFAMGLFKDVARAWVTVDSALFVWNYENNRDLAYYDGISNTVLTLVLSRAKPNTLLSHIQYVLCVVTSIDVILLGVNFLNANGEISTDFRQAEMNLIPEPLFKCSLDGVIISDAYATANCLIFLAGRDGCLYEFKYQTSNIFGRSCKKINHSKGIMSYLVPSLVAFTFGKDEPLAQIVVDESRNILFTRSEMGSLQVFDLGDTGSSQVSKVVSLSAQEIQYTAAQIVQTVEPSHFKQIVSICAVERYESGVINLIGTTNTGVRLYFSCYYDENKPNSMRPATLKLVHVRFPPGFCPSNSTVRPERVHKSLTLRETTLLVSAYDEQTDVLWCMSNSNFSCRLEFMETQMQLPLKGRTWVLSETFKSVRERAWLNNRRIALNALDTWPPLLATQHNESPKSFVLLTPQAYYIVERLRPVDVLRHLLVEFGPDSHNVRTFFQLHQASQAGAMCLILACSTTQHERQVCDKAIRALYLYGGEAKAVLPGFNVPYQNGFVHGHRDFSRAQPIRTSTPASTFKPVSRLYPDVTLDASTTSPTSAEQMTSAHQLTTGQQPGDLNLTSPVYPAEGHPHHVTTSGQRSLPPMMMSEEIKFSDKHNAYYLYFSRILSILWQSQIVTERTIITGNKRSIDVLDSVFSTEELAWFLEQILNFLEMMKRSSILPPNFLHVAEPGFHGPSYVAQRFSGYQRTDIHKADGGRGDAVYTEQQSLIALYELAQRCYEVLGLMKILTDHRIHLIIAMLSRDQQENLRAMTFDRLVVDGKDICADLVLCLLNQYLSDRATTDSVSERLRQVCPSLFTSDDATSAKANELLVTSRNVEDDEERKRSMDKALDMYKRIANQIHLPTVCAQLQEAQNFDAIVDLCLCAAKKLDPTDSALQYYKTMDSELDEESSIRRQLFMNRMACYKCMTDVMNNLLNASTGRHPNIPAQQAQNWMNSMIKLSLSDNTDELCHVAVFDWMFERGLNDLILKMRSPYTETYLLKRISATPHSSANTIFVDLLWKFYEQSRKFSQAAELLQKLAETHSTNVDLNQRITYLSRAVLCCKASTEISPSQAEFLHDLEDKLEVAKLQMQVVEALRQLPPSTAVRDAVTKLNVDLMDVTQLYTNYAQEFDLTECKLAIIRCSGHHDTNLIESLWRDIVDNELSLRSRESIETKSRLVGDKIQSLIKLYIDSPRFLPLNFLMKYLFAKSVDNSFEPSWLTETLLPAGVSYIDLLTALDSIFRQWTIPSKPIKKDRKLQIYVLKALSDLADNFCRNKSNFSPKDRSRLRTKFLDCLAFCMVELDTMPTGTETTVLRQKFSNYQTQLE